MVRANKAHGFSLIARSMGIATGCHNGGWAPPAVRKGEGGCFFDEIQDLVEATERLHMDVQAGPQRGRMPWRPRSKSSLLPAEQDAEASRTRTARPTENSDP
jgi:hypothetical protein